MTDPVAPVALGLAVILVVSKIGGDLAIRLGQVAVLGELVAGVLLGNVLRGPGVAWLKTDPSIDIFARFGALVLLFEVGLELGLLILTLVTGLISTAGAQGRLSPTAVATTVGKTVAFFVAAFAVGTRTAPALFAAERTDGSRSPPRLR